MFKQCTFLMGQEQTIVIVIPATLPEAETYTVSISNRDIRFRAGQESLASFEYGGGEVYERIAGQTQIGLVEHPPGQDMPMHITHVAYVEVRRAEG